MRSIGSNWSTNWNTMRYTWDFLSGVRLRELKKGKSNRKPLKCPRPLTGISALGNEYTVCMPVRMRFWKEVVSRYVCLRKRPFREFPLHYQRRNLIYLSAGPEVNDLLHYFIYKHNLLVRPSSLDKPFLLFVQDLLFLLGCLVLPRINKGKKLLISVWKGSFVQQLYHSPTPSHLFLYPKKDLCRFQLGSITSRCSRKEPAPLPRDTRERRKLTLASGRLHKCSVFRLTDQTKETVVLLTSCIAIACTVCIRAKWPIRLELIPV